MCLEDTILTAECLDSVQADGGDSCHSTSDLAAKLKTYWITLLDDPDLFDNLDLIAPPWRSQP